jgi:uncharacterized protein
MKAGDLQGISDLLADDVTWSIIGNSDKLPSSGRLDKSQFTQLLERMRARSETPLNIWITSMISEGDRIAVECESAIDLKNGRQYRQHYHIAIDCRAGKVVNAREYIDSRHAHEIWFTP